MECITLNTLTWAPAHRHLMPSGFLTARVLATDGECSDHYEFPICTVALCFPKTLVVAQYIVLVDSTSCGLNEMSHPIILFYSSML